MTTTPAPWPTRLPLIAILRGIRPDEAAAHVQVLVDAGFEAIEIPLNSPEWATSLRAVVTQFGDRALIGGGTVLQPSEVDALADTGARLMVTPHTRPALITRAVARGLQVAAGFATASEAFEALEAGAQALKLFPATTYGPGHVKALKAVLPAVPLFAVGGITPGNLAEYLRAGCTGAGLGGELYKPGQGPARTAVTAQAFVSAYRDAVAGDEATQRNAIHEVFAYLRVSSTVEAIRFYAQAFGAIEKFRLTEPSGRIGHAELQLGPAILMLSDAYPEIGLYAPSGDQDIASSIHLHVDDADALCARAVAAGATLVVAPTDQFYGERSGRLRDPFGHTWIVGHEIEKLSPQEMQRRYDALFK